MSAHQTDRPTGAARPWLAAYPPDVPQEVATDGLTLTGLFTEARRRFPARPALESFGTTLTYFQLGGAADAVTAWLQERGYGKGDRIAIMAPNVAAYPAILHGALAAGCTIVNVNPLYTVPEVVQQLSDAGAKVLFVLTNFAHTVAAAQPSLSLDTVVVVGPGDLLGLKGMIVDLVARRRAPPESRTARIAGALRFRDVIAAGRRGRPRPADVGPDDVAFLQYTGGTTGRAKGAVLLHRNVAANVEQTEAWFRPAVGRDGDRQVIVTPLPLYHIFALTCCCFYMCRIGGSMLLITNPRDIPAFIKTLRTRRFTLMVGVNTLYNALMNHADFGKIDFSGVRFCIGGGMAVQGAVAERWQSLTRRTILEGYGLSETSPVVCANRYDLAVFSGTIGYPLPSTDVSIRAADGSEVPIGERGELCVRGPQVMAGYWQRPEETAAAMTRDGFFRTGDVAVLQPDGQVRIVDRLKDMILVSGFNVYPNEVEDALARHPGVVECAVIGLPDAQSGEQVAAYVVPRDPAPSTDELREHLRTLLTPYKVPKRIEFRSTLPKTNVGKVLRRQLKEEVTRG